MSSLAVLFFLCLFLTLYPYLLFPLLVQAWSKLLGRGWRQEDVYPTMALLVSVYNEGRVIRDKIVNTLTLDYPPDRLQVVVVSDGSTDDTERIVAASDDPRIVLRAYPRGGKTACLNRAVAELEAEVVVFTDANSMFPSQALKAIARNFSDEAIGLVTGWTKYRRPGTDEAEAPGLYAQLEKVTKEAESRISSCVGADGAIFAIRRELYRRLEDYDINDFVIPLNVVAQGRRAVLDPEVYCFEEPAEGRLKEFRRQVRMTSRTLGAIWRNARFLNPAAFGSFSFFLLSHKLLRYLVPFFAAGTLLTSLLLAGEGLFYLLVAVGLSLFVSAGVMGLLNLVSSRLVDLCATFLVTNAAQVVGWVRFITGRTDTLWTPQR